MDTGDKLSQAQGQDLFFDQGIPGQSARKRPDADRAELHPGLFRATVKAWPNTSLTRWFPLRKKSTLTPQPLP